MNSSLAAGNADDFSSVASRYSSPGEVVQTAAEKAREKRLRDDPMADVLGPHFVSCRRCGNRIKLSPKSTYDPFHWQKHRERCLKKLPGAAPKNRRDSRDAFTATRKKPSKVAVGAGAAVAGGTAIDSTTPPMTTDDDDDMGAGTDRIKEESPSSLGLSNRASPTTEKKKKPSPPPVRQSNLAFREYMFRTHRKLTRSLSPPPLEPWYTWDWSQLTMPVWVVATYPDCGNDGEGDRPNASVDEQEQSRDVTSSSFSTLQRSSQDKTS